MKAPVFYSFRRCPYAMRARLALLAAGLPVVLREVVLRDKPAAFLHASASATVPCLVLEDAVIDESIDIMIWALKQNDPAGWLEMPDAGWEWIARCDGPFKEALDRTKYAARYPGSDPVAARASACEFLVDLEALLDDYLFGAPSLADFAVLPFVRQFAFVDRQWFVSQEWPKVHIWLDRFLESMQFAAIMQKYPQWHEADPEVIFPPQVLG